MMTDVELLCFPFFLLQNLGGDAEGGKIKKKRVHHHRRRRRLSNQERVPVALLRNNPFVDDFKWLFNPSRRRLLLFSPGITLN